MRTIFYSLLNEERLVSSPGEKKSRTWTRVVALEGETKGYGD